jgi:hypothetical protein
MTGIGYVGWTGVTGTNGPIGPTGNGPIGPPGDNGVTGPTGIVSRYTIGTYTEVVDAPLQTGWSEESRQTDVQISKPIWITGFSKSSGPANIYLGGVGVMVGFGNKWAIVVQVYRADQDVEPGQASQPLEYCSFDVYYSYLGL